MTETYQVKTAGKLYIAGEYAILTVGQTAIIKNIPIYMTATISESEHYLLDSDLFDHTAGLKNDSDYTLIQETITTFFSYIDQKPENATPFHLKIRGKMERDGKKLGIGSSGSVTVLVIKALAAFYNVDLSKDLIFKLASYTLIKIGDNGSMGDIACIAYDDLVAFTAFDRSRVREWIQSEDIKSILKKDWQYKIEPIKVKCKCDFLVGWTQKPSISKDMINLVKAEIDSDFLNQTQAAVLQVKSGLENADKRQVVKNLEKISQLLESLHPAIYTEDLFNLKNATEGLNAIAKSSGSGGGDCGIALSFDDDSTQTLITKWTEIGLVLLDNERL